MNRTVNGTVQDGLGQGRSFTQLDWVRQQLRDKVGFDPFPGTLNARVGDVSTLTEWQTYRGITIEPVPGFCAARCYRVLMNESIAVAWILPDVPGYPKDLMELTAPMSLRQALTLKTGDVVSIRFLESE